MIIIEFNGASGNPLLIVRRGFIGQRRIDRQPQHSHILNCMLDKGRNTVGEEEVGGGGYKG